MADLTESKIAPAAERMLDEQSGCWRRGEPRSVEFFLARDPTLRDDPERVLDLIYHEVLLRTRLKESPSLDEYVQRFPEFADQLKTQFEVHEALEPEVDARETLRPTSPLLAAVAPPPAVPGYQLIGELGHGGMGVVYEALHLGLKRRVALKMLRAGVAAGDDQLARFRTEAEALARLDHPHVVQVYEVGSHEGRPFFAMELVTGGSLEDRLHGEPQPPRTAARLLELLARAVHAAHENRLVHRDLKPANVLFAPCAPAAAGAVDLWGLPKITDFGLAKQLDADSLRTRSGDILGTPSYMAPEQAYGRNHAVGPATDVYALGAVLYEMLTGRPPFRGATVWDTLHQVGLEEPVPPRRLQPKAPRDLETVCLKCLHKEPRRRYPSAAALADDLRRFLDGSPVRARPLPWWERLARAVRRRPAVTVAVLLVAVLGQLHYFDLREQLACALAGERLLGSIAEVRGVLEKVEKAGDAGEWTHARSLLDGAALPALQVAEQDFAGEPRLQDRRSRAERVATMVAKRLNSREALRSLAAARDDAGFFATPMTGLDARSNLARTKAIVVETLKLFGISSEDDGPIPFDESAWSEAEATQIREGCCELLLDLAAAQAEKSSDETAQQHQAGLTEALRLVDRAAHVGVVSALIRARRAAYAHALAEPEPTAPERPQMTRAFEWFQSGVDDYRADRLTKAVHCFEKALTLEPGHYGAHYALGVCRLQLAARTADARPNLREAQVHLTECVNRHPDRVWPLVQRGYAFGEAEQFDQAEADFAAAERLLQSTPDDAALYGLLVDRGVIRVRRGRTDAAVADLSRARDLRPGAWQAYVNLAVALTERQSYAEAARQLDRLAEVNPNGAAAEVHRTRARILEAQGDLTAAVHELDQAILRSKENNAVRAADHFHKGRLLFRVGRHLEASAALDLALQEQPDLAAAEKLKAEALLQAGRAADAVASLDRYLKLEGRSNLAAAYRARAQAYSQLGDHAAAVEDYTRSLGTAPGDAEVLTGRGWAYLALEAHHLAQRDFQEALRLDPDRVDALLGRATVRAQTSAWADGVRDAERALTLAPPDHRRLYTAARAISIAAGRADGDPAELNPLGLEKRLKLQDRAVNLLAKSLEALPDAERTAFWTTKPAHDAAFAPIRKTLIYRQMASRFQKPE
jgi:tetratricopeptide (TPR) repeat protein/tRNA A-37 threonylcarbamoyl transferase component Bud32